MGRLTKKQGGKVLTLLKLTEGERLNLQRLGAEIRAGNLQHALKQAEADAYIKGIDPEGKYHRLIGDAMTAKVTVQQFVLQNNALVEAVSNRLGINLRKFSYDDESGVLHELDLTSGAPTNKA